MTIGQALDKFYNSFDLKAYPKTSVPSDAKMPYIVYDVSESSWDSAPVSQSVQLWYKTDSEAIPSAKAREIKDAIGDGGKLIKCENGVLWLRKGSPWCINAIAQDDNSIKLRQLNITIEFLIN